MVLLFLPFGYKKTPVHAPPLLGRNKDRRRNHLRCHLDCRRKNRGPSAGCQHIPGSVTGAPRQGILGLLAVHPRPQQSICPRRLPPDSQRRRLSVGSYLVLSLPHRFMDIICRSEKNVKGFSGNFPPRRGLFPVLAHLPGPQSRQLPHHKGLLLRTAADGDHRPPGVLELMLGVIT